MKKAQRTYTKVKDKKNIKLDHLVNVYSGSGVVGIDKSLADTYKFNKKRPEDLLSLYRDSSIARKIVDKEVRASSREGYKIIFKEDNLEASNWIYKRMKDLDFDNKFMDACIWSRLYGGCGIIIGILDGTSKMQEEYVPLNFNKIDYLTVVDSTKLEPSGQLIESDISSPNYSLPIYYKVNSGSKASASQNEKIHYSRIIKFHGVKIPLDALSQNNYWGDSVLQSIYSELNNYNSHNKTIRNVSENISIKIFKLKELREQILLSSEGKDKEISNSLQQIISQLSSYRALLLDSEEDFTLVSPSLAGVSDLFNQIKSCLVAATDMPHTVLLGESPSGLGATGRSEEDTWFDYVREAQINTYGPKIIEFVNVLISEAEFRSKFKNLFEFTLEFEPLKRYSLKERKEIEKIQCEIDDKYIGNGTLNEPEVRRSRFGDDGYSFDTFLSEEYTDYLSSEKEKQNEDA